MDDMPGQDLTLYLLLPPTTRQLIRTRTQTSGQPEVYLVDPHQSLALQQACEAGSGPLGDLTGTRLRDTPADLTWTEFSLSPGLGVLTQRHLQSSPLGRLTAQAQGFTLNAGDRGGLFLALIRQDEDREPQVLGNALVSVDGHGRVRDVRLAHVMPGQQRPAERLLRMALAAEQLMQMQAVTPDAPARLGPDLTGVRLHGGSPAPQPGVPRAEHTLYLDQVGPSLEQAWHLNPGTLTRAAACEIGPLATWYWTAGQPEPEGADLRPLHPVTWYELPEADLLSSDERRLNARHRPHWRGMLAAAGWWLHPDRPDPDAPVQARPDLWPDGTDSELVLHLIKEVEGPVQGLLGRPYSHLCTVRLHFDLRGRLTGEPRLQFAEDLERLAAFTRLDPRQMQQEIGAGAAPYWRYVLHAHRVLRLGGPVRTLHTPDGAQPRVRLDVPRERHHEALGTLEQRLSAHLKAVRAVYPDTLKWMLRHHAQGRKAKAWPDSTFVPGQDLMDALRREPGNRPPDAAVSDFGRLLLLGSWRAGRGLYRVDETLLAALWDTQDIGAVPVDVLSRLPEYTVYVPTPGLDMLGTEPLNGFYATLDDSRSGGQSGRWSGGGLPVLHLLLDSAGEALLHLPLMLQGHSVKDALDSMFGADNARLLPTHLAETYTRCLNVLLYLCSATGAADLSKNGVPATPQKPQISRVKGGDTLFPPDRLSVWDVGIRMGQALRQAPETGTPGDADHQDASKPTLTQKRPHLRRAHWHTYLTGPRSGPQHRLLKWLPPITVNFDLETDDPDTLPMVVHPLQS